MRPVMAANEGPLGQVLPFLLLVKYKRQCLWFSSSWFNLDFLSFSRSSLLQVFFPLEIKKQSNSREILSFFASKNSLEEILNRSQRKNFFLFLTEKENSFRNFKGWKEFLIGCSSKGQKGFELEGCAGNDIFDCRPKTRLSDFVWDTSVTGTLNVSACLCVCVWVHELVSVREWEIEREKESWVCFNWKRVALRKKEGLMVVVGFGAKELK